MYFLKSEFNTFHIYSRFTVNSAFIYATVSQLEQSIGFVHFAVLTPVRLFSLFHLNLFVIMILRII